MNEEVILEVHPPAAPADVVGMRDQQPAKLIPNLSSPKPRVK